MEDREHIKYIFAKYLSGTYTQEDLLTLLHYFDIADEEEQLKALIEKELDAAVDIDVYQAQIEEVDSWVRGSLKRKTHRCTKHLHRKQMVLGIAASVLLLIGIGGWIFFGNPVTGERTKASSLQEIDPGKNRAELVLANGQAITLSEDKTGIATEGGGIVYVDGTAIVQAEEAQYVTLSTPRAGQYQVTLSDGSKVWLNAESSLRYPTAFIGDQREVEVTGEAFFEIAPDVTHPFVVSTQGQKVVVLGTSFNVKAYQNEHAITTTLATGSIQLEKSDDGSVVTLAPGQQAVLQDNGIEVRQVDIVEAISWKDGIYVLNNSDLVELLQQLERWYDVEVASWPGGETRLSAIIPRNAKLREVLQAIELKTGLRFNIEERRIMIIE